jgi:PqqD family protein of HPr-rel-A system
VPSRVRGRSEGVIARESGDELLVLDTTADRIHQLNATAGYIWEQLEQGSTDEEIVASFAEEFEIDPGQARTDVAATLANLRAVGLLA